MSEAVRVAHGDAWQVLGAVHASTGGGVATFPGVRLMASGLPHPQWNNGDVDDPSAVDIGAVAAWYAERDLPWGLRIPTGVGWAYGRLIFQKRLMGLEPDHFLPASMDGLTLRRAQPLDVHTVLAIDAIGFNSEPDAERPWIEPHLGSPKIETVLASLDGRAIGTAYCVTSNLRAGPAAYVVGVCVLPDVRGRGVGVAMSSWLVEGAFRRGARLAHVHPDDDRTASMFGRLGFEEVPGFDVYVDVPATMRPS